MDNKKFEELKGLIEVKKNIFEKLKDFLKEKFSVNREDLSNIEIKYFEDRLSKQERVQRKKEQAEIDRKCKYYDEFLANPEEFLGYEGSDEEYFDEDYDYEVENSDENAKSKEEFFELYENIKNGKAGFETLSITELLKVEAMLREEISLKAEKIEESDMKKIEVELKQLEEENKMLLEELKKLENK